MMTAQLVKDLMDANFFVVSLTGTTMYSVVKKNEVGFQSIQEFARQAGLTFEAYRILHPYTEDAITFVDNTLCTDDLDILYYQGTQLLKVPMVDFRPTSGY